MKCKRSGCNHDDFTHLMGEGQCQTFIVLWGSEFHEIEIAPGLKGWNQDVKYGGQCECKQFMSTKSVKSKDEKQTSISSF